MAIAWQKNEDELLTETVLKHCKRGASMDDAFMKAAKMLDDKNYSACSRRWYENFQELYKEEIASIRKTTKRVNDYVGPWKFYDDEKLMKLIVASLIKGEKIQNALISASKEMGRSFSSCSSRWYDYIKKKNSLTIEIMVKEGKEKMATKTIARSWDQQKEKTAIGMIKNAISRGESITDGTKLVAERFKMKASTVQNYWYAHLYPEHKQQIDDLRNLQDWKKEEKYELFKVATSAKASGQSLQSAFDLISVQLNKPRNEVQNFWYHKVRMDKDFAKRYEEEKAVQTSQQTELPLEEKQEAVVKVLHTEEAAPIPSSDLVEEANGFVTMINSLVEQNKALKEENEQLKQSGLQLSVLEAENQMLKSDLAKIKAEKQHAEGFKEEYDKLLSTMERARKIVLDSDLGFNVEAK